MFYSYVIIAISFILVVVFISKKRVSLKSAGVLFIWVTHFLGYPLFHLRYLLDNRYDSITTMSLDIPLSYSFIGISLYMLTASLFKGGNVTNEIINFSEVRDLDLLKYSYLFLFIVSISAYVIMNGVSFNHSGDYADRLDDNAGNGLLLINMVAFVPVIIINSIKSETKISFYKSIIWIVMFGFTYFFVIGGSRNVFGAAVLIYILIGYYKGYLKSTHILIIGMSTFFLLNILILLRYDVSLSNMDANKATALFISYFTDSISPINYQADAIQFVLNSSASIENSWGLFFNQFLALVPRFLWTDKPIVMMNSSYYFTQYVLGLPGNLNMASTMLSSSIIIMKEYYYILYIIAALLLSIMDFALRSRYILVRMLIFISMPFLFFMARESLELYLFILFKYFLMLLFGYIVYGFLYLILPRKI
ncbi:WzyE family oligosaccharide polymerase [Vibrio cholerae]